jgi:hypothetical protein
MMILAEPRTDQDGELHFVALAECKLWKAIRGVTVLELFTGIGTTWS